MDFRSSCETANGHALQRCGDATGQEHRGWTVAGVENRRGRSMWSFVRTQRDKTMALGFSQDGMGPCPPLLLRCTLGGGPTEGVMALSPGAARCSSQIGGAYAPDDQIAL